MTQLSDLAFCLLAAGGAQDPTGRGLYLLYFDPETSCLVAKLWAGASIDKFESVETIAEGVRPDTTAPYIIAPSIRLIAYISSQNDLRISLLDEESDEWLEEESVQQKVHPNGQVAAALTDKDRIRVIAQDPSGKFTLFDKTGESWSSTTLPADPKAGTPIGTTVTEDRLYIFYVSANDNSLHYLVEDDGKQWKDVALESCVFDEKSKPKRFTVIPEGDNTFQVFVMTESNTVWMFSQDSGKLEKLGYMAGSEYMPDTSEQRSRYIKLEFRDCVIA